MEPVFWLITGHSCDVSYPEVPGTYRDSIRRIIKIFMKIH
jgi:hypothetical protein